MRATRTGIQQFSSLQRPKVHTHVATFSASAAAEAKDRLRCSRNYLEAVLHSLTRRGRATASLLERATSLPVARVYAKRWMRRVPARINLRVIERQRVILDLSSSLSSLLFSSLAGAFPRIIRWCHFDFSYKFFFPTWSMEVADRRIMCWKICWYTVLLTLSLSNLLPHGISWYDLVFLGFFGSWLRIWS